MNDFVQIYRQLKDCEPVEAEAASERADLPWRDFAPRDDGPEDHRESQEPRRDGERLPTPFAWRDPESIPSRPWVYGRHLIRKQVSVTVAPGGVGKSSLTICEALAMASGRELLGEWTEKDLKVWIYNLEDQEDELDRRIVAAMQHHQVSFREIDGRLFRDTGRNRALCTAIQSRGGIHIVQPEMRALEREIKARSIDVLVVDPCVSSHQVSENDNGAIDLVAKEWARLADRCNCAIELVHHTRKTNGEEATTEAGRGAYSLLAAARSGRVLNKMSDEMKKDAGIEKDNSTYFSIARDKANLAPMGARTWCRMASVQLANGDNVGVAELWAWPDAFDGVSLADLLAVQQAVEHRVQEGRPPRLSDQAGNEWVGVVVANVLGLDPEADRKRLKKLLGTWLKTEALIKESRLDATRRPRPCVVVGEWATA
ncbi:MULTISPECIES: AAA family ATPase [Roseobacteraceae]|uniref:AAA family ATPase n=1 Tax=Roseobacteraceae TaxID=2854170 RepID=UPI0031E4542A